MGPAWRASEIPLFLGVNMTSLYNSSRANCALRPSSRRFRVRQELALNRDVVGAAYHESAHELFAALKRHGADNVVALLERLGGNKLIKKRLQQLLEKSPAKLSQLETPEELVAYAYQFWRMGALQLGPDTTTFFKRVTLFLKKLAGLVTNEMRDAEMAEAIFAQFSGGLFRDAETRQDMMNAVGQAVEVHDRMLDSLDEGMGTTMRAFGRFTFSAEAMMKGLGSTHMSEIMRRFNQDAGEAMEDKAAYFDAVKQARDTWMNRFGRIIENADKEDLRLAHEALRTGRVTHNPESVKIVAATRKLLDEFHSYFDARGARRLNPATGVWERIPKRGNYFPRVWDHEDIGRRFNEFVERLLKHHFQELTLMATGANKASGATGEGKMAAKDVAEAIVTRLSRGGTLDIGETESSLGISPAAQAVNQRVLDWIDDAAFDDFKEKDFVKVMSTYLVGMSKRAEYSHLFGPDGGWIRKRVDRAVLFELGGKELVAEAQAALPEALRKWSKEDPETRGPAPTARSVGQGLYFGKVGRKQGVEDLTAALEKLQPGIKAIMAMEGTLGRDISPKARATSSAILTYQSFRLLIASLFAQANDIMGLVANGAEISDAWQALQRGVKEIALSWKGTRGNDGETRRAEIWGTVEPSEALDTLGETYGSMYLDGRARKMTSALFRWNGMSAFNRAMRITATSVAERVIRDYAKHGVDQGNPATVAAFERLFGKGFKAENIKLTESGELDLGDAKNRAAMMRWVNDAVMTPNAAHRPVWASDPHFAAWPRSRRRDGYPTTCLRRSLTRLRRQPLWPGSQPAPHGSFRRGGQNRAWRASGRRASASRGREMGDTSRGMLRGYFYAPSLNQFQAWRC